MAKTTKKKILRNTSHLIIYIYHIFIIYTCVHPSINVMTKKHQKAICSSKCIISLYMILFQLIGRKDKKWKLIGKSRKSTFTLINSLLSFLYMKTILPYLRGHQWELKNKIIFSYPLCSLFFFFRYLLQCYVSVVLSNQQ